MTDRTRANTDETPLFQDMDEQEQALSDNAASGVDVVPVTGGAFQAAEVAPMSSTTTGSKAGIAAPVAGAAALAEETEQDNASDRQAS